MINQTHWLGLRAVRGAVLTDGWQPLSETREVHSPADGSRIGTVAIASEQDIARACAFAKKSFHLWKNLSPFERGNVLNRAADVAQSNAEELCDWLVKESGAIPAKAAFEVDVSIKAIRVAAGMAAQAAGDVLPSESTSKISIARRRPLGVVGIISPFNFPLYLAMRAVAPALAVGNAVVLKPDTRTALSGGLVIARMFEDAGLPPGVLQVLPGDGIAGAELCRNKHVALIQFTGSTQAGRKVGALAGEHLKKVSLELGGKNSLIVCQDADLDLAASNAAWGGFFHQGQICMASSRILVHKDVASTFLEKLVHHANSLTVGSPFTDQVHLGPMIGEEQAALAATQVRDSVSDGAKLLTGGNPEGAYFPPTVLSGVTKAHPVYEVELFAPVVSVTEFGTYEEAIQIANDSNYGLSVGVITNDLARALHMSEELDFGICHINNQTVGDDVVNPFGGTGESGNGTSIGGPANWELFTHWQWLTFEGSPPKYPF